MRNVDFIDLSIETKSIKECFLQKISKLVDTNGYIGGKFVSETEERFAEYCGVKYAVSVNSGTTALYLSLITMGVKEGDIVATIPNTFFATIEAICQVGAKVAFIDIKDDYLMDYDKLIKADKKINIDYVIPVSLHGQISDHRIFDEFQCVEDACQSHGASYKGKMAGSFGCVGCFSFYPSKNIGAFGEGGMVTTNDEGYYNYLLALRNHGIINGRHCMVGTNGRLNAIQALSILLKMEFIDQWNGRRNEIANIYHKRLSKHFITPRVLKEYYDVYHHYVLMVNKPDLFISYLSKHNIEAKRYYNELCDYDFVNTAYKNIKKARNINSSSVCIPIHLNMSDDDVHYVSDICEKFIEEKE